MWQKSGSLFLSISIILLTLAPNRSLDLNSASSSTKTPMESGQCKLLLMLNDSSLEKVYFNDDTSPDYKFLTGLENSQNRVIVAVRNKVNLVLIHFTDSASYKEHLLKKFSHAIRLVEPHWFFGQIYVLTFNPDDVNASAYQIDLNLRVFARLFSFKATREIFMLADPFQGTLTFNYDNRLLAINTLYLANYEKSNSQSGSYSLVEYPYANVLLQYGTCNHFESLRFITTSSLIDGYSKLQTYYIRTDLDKYLECYVFERECDCMSVTNQTILDNIQTVDEVNSKRNECNDPKDASLPSPIQSLSTYSNRAFQNTKLKSCLRICSLPKWKKSLYDRINTGPHSWNKVPLNQSQTPLPCVNQLEIDDSLEKIGYTRVSNQTGAPRVLQIQFTERFGSQLLTQSCSRLEMNFKYIATIREVLELANLNFLNKSRVQTNVAVVQDSNVFIELKSGMAYELIIEMQTPFDVRPYHIGSYLLNERINTSFLEPDYKELQLKPTPYILDDYWSQLISDKDIIVTLLIKADEKNNDLEKLKNMFYLLTNMDSKSEFQYENILKSSSLEIDYYHSDPNFYQVLFRIPDLVEDQTYHLRVMDKNNEGSMTSLSNLVSFQTLKRPSIAILSHDRENNVMLEIRIRCRFTIHDLTSVDLPKYKDDPSHFNICNYFSIFMTENDTNTTGDENWTLAYHEQIFSNHKLTDSFSEETLYSTDLVKNMTISNFSYSTHYSMSLRINYYTNNLTMDSNVLHFDTFEEPQIKTPVPKYTPDSIYIFVALFSLLGAIFFCGILTGFKKKSMNKFLMAIGLKKNDLTLENSEFIDKITNTNMLYSWSSHKKLLSEKVEKLTKINESQLTIIKNIGRGTFGEVFEGTLRLDDTLDEMPVAIKKLRVEASDFEKFDLIKEAVALGSFKHNNLIKLYGICLEEDNPKYLVLEYMKLGDLLSYLRGTRKLKNMNLKRAVKMSIDIAKGCEFLEQNKMVHRDIAARNCLVTTLNKDEANGGNNIIVKIGDFGLARELYVCDYYQQGGDRLLPIRWMSPEAIFDGLFTTQSDIWSFGILLWEVITLGHQPYPGMENKQVIDLIKNGNVLQIPERCPPEISEIMRKCWNEVNTRPSFKSILQSLELILSSSPNILSEPLPIYKEMKSKLEPSTSKQRTKPSSSSTDCDDDLISRYTSDTLATMLTNRSSVSQPHQLTTGATLASMSQQGNNDNNSNNKLAFIEKYTDEELPDSDLIDSNEASKFLVDETRL